MVGIDSKKTLVMVLSSLGLILIFLIFIYFSPQTVGKAVGDAQVGSEGPPAFLDCGTDFDCFITAAADCTPSNVTHNHTFNVIDSGLPNSVSTYYEMKGEVAGECFLYKQIKTMELNYSEGLRGEMFFLSTAELEQRLDGDNELLDQYENQESVCDFDNNSDLVTLLNQAQTGNFSILLSCNITDGNLDCADSRAWDAVADCNTTIPECVVNQDCEMGKICQNKTCLSASIVFVEEVDKFNTKIGVNRSIDKPFWIFIALEDNHSRTLFFSRELITSMDADEKYQSIINYHQPDLVTKKRVLVYDTMILNKSVVHLDKMFVQEYNETG